MPDKGNFNCVLSCVAIDARKNRTTGEISATIQSKPNGGNSLNFINPILTKTYAKQAISVYKESEQASTCSARDYKSDTDLIVAYSFDSLNSNSMKSGNPNSGCRKTEIGRTVDTTIHDPSKNQGGIAILQRGKDENL